MSAGPIILHQSVVAWADAYPNAAPTWAEKLESPFVRVYALAGVVEGMAKAKAAAKVPAPKASGEAPKRGGPPVPHDGKSEKPGKENVPTIRGRVVDEKGRGVAKAQLWLPLREEPPTQAEAVADEHGSFQLTVPDDWLDQPFWRRRGEIWAYAKGHAIARAPVEAALFDGSKDPIEICLGPLTKTSFLVVDPEGKPVVGASVTPQGFYVPKLNRHDQPPAPLASLLSAVTDEKGGAALPAVSTRHLTMLRVVSKGYGTQDHVFLDAPEDAPERTIGLRSVGRIEGQVIAAKPEWARGIKLTFRGVRGHPPAGGSAAVETDADGKFVVPQMAAGRYYFIDTLDPRLPVRALPQRDHVIVAGGETTTVTIPLVPAVRVRGRVRIVESDKPLPGAIVRVHGNLREGVEVRADDEGRYELLLAPGNVYLNVHVPREYYQKLVPRFIGSVTVPEGVETFDLPTIELVKTARYEGRLIDSDGKPVAGAIVSGNDGRQNLGRGETDRDGRFSLIATVDIESYRVWVKGIQHDAPAGEDRPAAAEAAGGDQVAASGARVSFRGSASQSPCPRGSAS